MVIFGFQRTMYIINRVSSYKENYVMNKAQELNCSSNCLVPCGVIHVCRIEAGLLTQSLCKNVGGVSITFD